MKKIIALLLTVAFIFGSWQYFVIPATPTIPKNEKSVMSLPEDKKKKAKSFQLSSKNNHITPRAREKAIC